MANMPLSLAPPTLTVEPPSLRFPGKALHTSDSRIPTVYGVERGSTHRVFSTLAWWTAPY
jgi:hypothetical protein